MNLPLKITVLLSFLSLSLTLAYGQSSGDQTVPYTREIYTQLSNSTRYQYQVLIHSTHPPTPKTLRSLLSPW